MILAYTLQILHSYTYLQKKTVPTLLDYFLVTNTTSFNLVGIVIGRH
jgi:hypothetical protein